MTLGASEKLPPLSNRGGRDSETYAEYERYEQVVIDSDGEIKVVPLRRGRGNTAFIDTLSFTFHTSAIDDWAKLNSRPFPFTNRDFVILWSQIAHSIFGFGISSEYSVGKGRFYDERWEMSAEGILYGQMYIGGQNDTVLIEINGTGCNVALDGWENRLYDFLKTAFRARITRCDIAKDFFNDEISPDSAFEAWQNGEFSKRGKAPLVAKLGSDWENKTKNGKTLVIGSKHSSVYTRIYDKAKEQGDKSGVLWTRFEQQFMGRNCILDLDILLNPGQFWGGSYPICADLQESGEKTRNVATLKKLEMSIEHCKQVAANQVGRAVNMMLGLGMTDSEIVEHLRNKDGLLPARVRPAGHVLNYAYLNWIHDQYDGAIEVVIPDEFGMLLEGFDENEQVLSLFDS